jgi:FecR-like protein
MKRQQKGSSRSKGDGSDILDALQEYDTQRTKRIKKEKFQGKMGKLFGWLRAAPGWIKGALIAAVVILVALIGDGIRRESGEMNATMVAFQGKVTVQRGGGTQSVNPQPKMALSNKDVVKTGPNSTATLVFPDGSAVQLEPNTEFEVRLLDYARGGERDRSFMVRTGSVIANVSRFFGAKSQATICTPTSVAAVRGTGFRVVYDPQQKQTYVQVVEGKVTVRTPAGTTDTGKGQMVRTAGYQVGGVQGLPGRRETSLGGQLDQMTRQYEKAPGVLERVEMAVNGFFDPFLQILGLTPGSWSYNTNNFARKAACMEALRRLRTHLAGAATGGDVPNYLNPVTLEEIQQDPREVRKLLDAFAGNMLESYQKTGSDTYIIRARARNRGRTLYELTEASVREVRE